MGLFVGYDGCSREQKEKIQAAEKRLEDYLTHICNTCSTTAPCIECEKVTELLRKLKTNALSCAATDTSSDPTQMWGASAQVGGTTVMIYPALIRSPASYRCITSSLFHELLHSTGMNHINDNRDESDPVYAKEFACFRAGICKGELP